MDLLVMAVEMARPLLNQQDLALYDRAVRPGVKFANELFALHTAAPVAGWASVVVLVAVATVMLIHTKK